jgi:predicted nucleic acid-binding protein
MTRFVIEPSVVLTLAQQEATVPREHKLYAPTLLRSQVLAELFVRVQRGKISKKQAGLQLDYLRGLQVRFFGDRVLQRVAWDMALDLDRKDTFVAEYLALTKLQADALVTTDASLAAAASKVIAVATIDDLLA